MGPGVAPASTNNNQQAAAAPIPVTAARAERDAMANAVAANSLRTNAGANGGVIGQLARRIAAALHAPPSVPAAAFEFVWAVGLTTDDDIVVANPYGIGYIPDGVSLPEQAILVSADDAIPARERGTWVGLPYLALQGWAHFHGKSLKMIFGTETELKGFDVGAAKDVLQPDDIPENGTMQGRGRLQVISAAAAAALDGVSDIELASVLPPRPVQDVVPDEESAQKLWMEMLKPLMRTIGSNAGGEHLKRFIEYAVYRQQAALYRAYTAPYVVAQREAISEWIYWQHVTVIIADALNSELV